MTRSAGSSAHDRDSTPWWPDPARTPAAHQRADRGARRRRLLRPRLLRLGDRHRRPSTPLAADGLRYTNFHTTALCSPTRACLLTGRNHHSVGMGVLANWDTGFPGYRGTHRARAPATLAEMLRRSGYNTFAVGKWHLTPMERDLGGRAVRPVAAGARLRPLLRLPRRRDRPVLPGAVLRQPSVEPPTTRRGLSPERGPGRPGDRLRARPEVGRVRTSRSSSTSRFGAAHAPHQAPRRPDREVPRRGSTHGWDAERDERLARQNELGIVPAGTELAPRNAGVVAVGRAVATTSSDCSARLQEAFAGFLDHTDAQHRPADRRSSSRSGETRQHAASS